MGEGAQYQQKISHSPNSVQNGQNICRQIRRHAPSLGRSDDESQRQEKPPHEEKARENRQRKSQLTQRPHKVHDVEGLAGVNESRPDSEISDDEQAKHQEGARSHRPTEADSRDQTSHHDGEDDAAQTRSTGCDTEGESSSTCEPRAHGADGGEENGTGAERAAESLRQEEVPVLG